MTTQELKEYINSKLGNSLRTLLPSYWWKRLFGLVVDRVEEVDNKVEEVDNKIEDLKNSSDYITFYLTSDPSSEWAEKNYVSFLKATQILEAGNTCPILIQTSHDENFGKLFTDTYVTGGIEYNLYMLTLPKVQFGRSTCNIHLMPFDKAVTCEVERLTFEDNGHLAESIWSQVKSVELIKELSDINESLPINRIVEYDNLEDMWVTSPWTIREEGPSFIYGFVGNSEVVDGKIENADLSTVTISNNVTPNYTLQTGWYDTEGKFNETDARIDLMRTRICSSEISVIPNKEYAIVSETNNFGIEIFEYDEQKNFIQKTNKVITSNRFGLQLANSSITFTENTKYITFNLYNHGNDVSQTDIVFLDASQPYSSTRINYGVSGQNNLPRVVLRGLPAGRDTIIGSVYTKRVGTRKYQDGDVNSDYLLTDGTTTLYVLNPDEYEIQTAIPRGISFLGTGMGCTISSNIPMYFLAFSNASKLALTGLGASSKTWDAYLYSEMLNKQESLISGTNIKTINGESILGSGNIEVSSGGPSYDDTELNNKLNGLQTQIDTLVSGDASAAIESFNEITAFLNGVEDTESLDGIIAGIEQQITNKQDTIADLETIRNGAALGATALQELQDISHLATKEELTSLSNEVVANEEVTAAALNELNERVNEISENVSGSTVTKEEFKEAIDTLQKEVIDNEEVVAAALNDLDVRVKEVSANVSGETATKVELQDAVTSLTNAILENEEVTAAALNDLNERIADIINRLNNSGLWNI